MYWKVPLLLVAPDGLASDSTAGPADAPSGEVTNQQGHKRRKTQSTEVPDTNEVKKQKKGTKSIEEEKTAEDKEANQGVGEDETFAPSSCMTSNIT